MKRRGNTVWELLAACFLLGVLATTCLQFIHEAAGQRRAADQRMTAVEEAANLLEQFSDRPWDELTPEAARSAKLSAQAAQSLPGGEVEVQIDGPEGTPAAKHIIVLIRWQTRDGQPCRPVRLVAWRYEKRK